MNLFNKASRSLAIASAFLGFSAASFAITIPMTEINPGEFGYENAYRKGSLSTSIDGVVVGGFSGTAKDDDITDAFGDAWTNEGDTNAGNGLSNGLLTITLTGGAWGQGGPFTGTWAIDSSFWDMYGRAVISMHVGGGQHDPDWFLWEIETGGTSGTFSYAKLGGTGGGLSNLNLWGAGEPEQVPDAGTSAILLGLGLISVALFRRKIA
jgi:hypothetical protein